MYQLCYYITSSYATLPPSKRSIKIKKGGVVKSVASQTCACTKKVYRVRHMCDNVMHDDYRKRSCFGVKKFFISMMSQCYISNASLAHSSAMEHIMRGKIVKSVNSLKI